MISPCMITRRTSGAVIILSGRDISRVACGKRSFLAGRFQDLLAEGSQGIRLAASHFFNPACQFCTTVMSGEAADSPPAGTSPRNRCPSSDA